MAKKEFKAGLYAVVSGVIVAALLVVITIFAYTARYNGFDAEKVAAVYVDTIVQNGDGYNAYKNSLVAKNQKYGDFIRAAYMAPYVNDGDDVAKAEFVGTGNEEEAAAIDKVYSTMYDYYVELLKTYGFDNYDNVFDKYFAKLVEVRKEVYGDDYMDTEYMFGAFEANVLSYGQSLTGTEEVLGADDKTVVQEASTGIYQEMFGEDYTFTTTVKSCEELTDDDLTQYIAAYKERITPVSQMGEAKADKFNLQDTEKEKKILFIKTTEKINTRSSMIDSVANLDNSESITAVAKCVVDVTTADGTVVATQELYVVQIGNTWYVDNTNIDTDSLYLALDK